ncbi:MAG: hypothetical protein JNL52_00660 [Flavobacteriales bacterium]|nr:hypothetical protein [Flavobacteriales bacterium]
MYNYAEDMTCLTPSGRFYRVLLQAQARLLVGEQELAELLFGNSLTPFAIT